MRKATGSCHYCPKAAGSWDHIVPKSKGGPACRDNLVPACVPCNNAKADSDPTCTCKKCQEAIRKYSGMKKKKKVKKTLLDGPELVYVSELAYFKPGITWKELYGLPPVEEELLTLDNPGAAAG